MIEFFFLNKIIDKLSAVNNGKRFRLIIYIYIYILKNS